MQKDRALVLRSNRFLGNAFVDKGLISMSDLEAANDRLMEYLQDSELRRASILNILMYELKVLDEQALVTAILEDHPVGLIDLAHTQISQAVLPDVDLNLSRLTATVPFDKIEGNYFVATGYYLSAPVIKHWSEILDGPIIWYVSGYQALVSALDTIEEGLARAAKEASPSQEPAAAAGAAE